jgi:hypothetical protein
MAAEPNSPAFAALCGIDAASASVPASLAVAASTSEFSEPFLAGPLTVERADDLATVDEPRAGSAVRLFEGFELDFRGVTIVDRFSFEARSGCACRRN